jgi:Domain of unknown function (DUF4359)
MGEPPHPTPQPTSSQPVAATPVIQNRVRLALGKCASRKGFALLSLLLLGVGSGLTNPSQAAYETYVTDQTSGFLLQEVCNKQAQAPEIVVQALKQGCEALSHGHKSDIRKFVHQHTQHYNFGVISLYTTDLPGYQLRTLGFWQNFFIVSLG